MSQYKNLITSLLMMLVVVFAFQNCGEVAFRKEQTETTPRNNSQEVEELEEPIVLDPDPILIQSASPNRFVVVDGNIQTVTTNIIGSGFTLDSVALVDSQPCLIANVASTQITCEFQCPGAGNEASVQLDVSVIDGSQTAILQDAITCVYEAAPGHKVYSSPGTFTFTVPKGVTSVSAVAVGAGGGGAEGITNGRNVSSGGGGGALAYGKDIAVTPGQKITVRVGKGGVNGPRGGNLRGRNGTSSSFGGFLIANGGKGGTTRGGAGGTYGGSAVTSGGKGGNGGGNNGGGGGGAGGYTGKGGNGTTNNNGRAGAGGGGGGGAGGNYKGTGAGGGGGTGLYGKGSNGAGGTNLGQGKGGSSGKGGKKRVKGYKYNSATQHGGYPGGGAGGSYGGGNGANGGVRIVWGQDL